MLTGLRIRSEKYKDEKLLGQLHRVEEQYLLGA